MIGGRAKFADECAAILGSVASRDGGSSIEQIMAETGLPSAQVVDLIHNYLAKNIVVEQTRVRGVRVTRYVARPT